MCNEEILVPSITDLALVDQADETASFSEASSDTEENVFSDASTETASSVSCTSECCQTPPPEVSKAPSHRQKVLAYLGYATCFPEDSRDRELASKIIDNIFRYIISRIPRLLVRARQAGCTTVECFLTSAELEDEDYARLWRALKYSNLYQEGKITVEVIRSAICNAENSITERKGPFIELLGGKVWKASLDVELSTEGYDHFYRFVSL